RPARVVAPPKAKDRGVAVSRRTERLREPHLKAQFGGRRGCRQRLVQEDVIEREVRERGSGRAITTGRRDRIRRAEDRGAAILDERVRPTREERSLVEVRAKRRLRI